MAAILDLCPKPNPFERLSLVDKYCIVLVEAAQGFHLALIYRSSSIKLDKKQVISSPRSFNLSPLIDVVTFPT